MNNLNATAVFSMILKGILQILSPFIIVLICAIIIYSIFTACSTKFLTRDGRHTNFGKLLLGGFSKSITMIIEKLPGILIIAIAITGVSMASAFFNQFTTIWEQEKRIKELNTYVQNLSNSEDIAIITVKDRNVVANQIYSTYVIEVIDNITGEVVTEEEIRLSSKELKLDSLVINFDYSDIETGKNKNVAFPYKIFSEKLAPDNGIKLKTIFSLDDIDDILELEADSAYGLTRDAFIKRAKEFIAIIKDPVKSREMGIKSSYGQTISIPSNAKPGDKYFVRITGVGGLTLAGGPSL
nr:hypothetical protein [uncultured Treponema sp.]